MSSSTTRNVTFTLTEARYVAAKMGADLRLLHNLYGSPGLASIDNYVEESALLLRDGYLKTVDFGFKSPNQWKLRLRYTATSGGQLRDDPPGRFPSPSDLSGLSFHSYLEYSQDYWNLTTDGRAKVKAALPVNRIAGDGPTIGTGNHSSGHGYGKNGQGVTRDYYSAF